MSLSNQWWRVSYQWCPGLCCLPGCYHVALETPDGPHWCGPASLKHLCVGRIASAHNGKVGWAKVKAKVPSDPPCSQSLVPRQCWWAGLPEPHREPRKGKLGDKQIPGNRRFGLVILTGTVLCQWHIWAVGKAPRAYKSKQLKLHRGVQTSFRGDLRIVSAERRQSPWLAFALTGNCFWHSILVGPHSVRDLWMFLIPNHWVLAMTGTVKWTRTHPWVGHIE